MRREHLLHPARARRASTTTALACGLLAAVVLAGCGQASAGPVAAGTGTNTGTTGTTGAAGAAASTTSGTGTTTGGTTTGTTASGSGASSGTTGSGTGAAGTAGSGGTSSGSTGSGAAGSSTGSAAAEAGTHFSLRKPGAALPSSATCAARVRAVAAPREIRTANTTANHTKGKRITGATGLQKRVDGAFTGTTEQILRWAACKWGVDEDMVKGQAVVESWWRQGQNGDWTTDESLCPPGHGLGVDGTADQCAESHGLLQVRYTYNKSAYPMVMTSTAMNVDYAFSQWRSCYEGEMTWLDTVEHTGTYAAGDAWGCTGVWFAGRWRTTAAKTYIARVKSEVKGTTWTTKTFRAAS